MIRVLVKILYALSLVLILLAGGTTWLVSTTSGLHTFLKLSAFYHGGNLKIHQIKGSLLHAFTLERLEYQNKDLGIKIAQLAVQWDPHLWNKSQLIKVEWHNLQTAIAGTTALSSRQGNMTASGVLPNLKVDLHASIQTKAENHWQLALTIQGSFPWKWIFDAKLFPNPDKQAEETGLHANLSIQGMIKAKNQGHLDLKVDPGFYQLADKAIPALQFQGGSIKIDLIPDKARGIGLLTIDKTKKIQGEFQLPHFSLDKGLSTKQPINALLSLSINSLDFLQNISPEISKIKGQISASLEASGTLAQPKILSKLTLNNTSLSLPKLGLDLNAMDLMLQSKEKNWQATGSVVSAGHNLLVEGQGSLTSEFRGDFKFVGEDFPLIKTNEYEINISPNLKLHLTPTEQHLSGSILVPYAQIKLQTFQNSISLPDELTYKHQKRTAMLSLTNSMDISIDLGNTVEINVKGLKGHLDGSLYVKQMPFGPVNAYGELSISNGTYKAYGQDLAIKRGQLIFSGGQMNNPGINLRATKKINNTPRTFSSFTQLFDFNTSNLQSVHLGDTITLGVEVTGHLSNPKVQLFSNPAILSQADILSLLVLGRPANQANKAGGQLLLTAISSMNVGSNSLQLLEQLKQSSGIDFNLQTNSNYNQLTNTVTDSTAFVVGKSLSKRMYLSYNIGLSQKDSNMLTFKYLLNKFFSIQISNSDSSSAIDFLYTANKKTKRSPPTSSKNNSD